MILPASASSPWLEDPCARSSRLLPRAAREVFPSKRPDSVCGCVRALAWVLALPMGATLILAARAVGIDRHMDSRQVGSDACGAWIFQHISGFNKLIMIRSTDINPLSTCSPPAR